MIGKSRVCVCVRERERERQSQWSRPSREAIKAVSRVEKRPSTPHPQPFFCVFTHLSIRHRSPPTGVKLPIVLIKNKGGESIELAFFFSLSLQKSSDLEYDIGPEPHQQLRRREDAGRRPRGPQPHPLLHGGAGPARRLGGHGD